MTTVQGRRLPDTELGDLPLPIDDLQPGDIWRYVQPGGKPTSAKALYPDEDMSGNLTDEVWGYCCPGGLGIGMLALHTVRSHEDGTISIRPGDGSSNSVLHTKRWAGQPDRQWHGYVEHNVWKPV